MDYTIVKVGDRAVGGMMKIGGPIPEGTPPHWNVIFAVADTDATAAKAEKLGGKVVFPPSDMPGVGRFASLTDPQGASFTVMTGEGEPPAPPD
jgi:predicted enzyme related to lactoylglutathione lyase